MHGDASTSGDALDTIATTPDLVAFDSWLRLDGTNSIW